MVEKLSRELTIPLFIAAVLEQVKEMKKKQVKYVPKTKALRLKNQRCVKEVIGGQLFIR
ncbi:MAG: hypothetical protein LC643_04680 [Bacteroidales bacterium]|nr:hypothetical protein [Bacteroidales bacterium]